MGNMFRYTLSVMLVFIFSGCEVQEDLLSVSEGIIHVIPIEGGTFEVTLQHDVAYEVQISEDVTWIHEIQSKAQTTTVHKFSVDRNTTGAFRTAEIYFVSLESDVYQQVTVQQPGKRQFGFRVVHSNMTFEEPHMTGSFTGNVSWTMGESCALGTYPVYTYKQGGEKTVTFDLYGHAEGFTFELRSLEGISEIDLSGM